MTIPLSVALQLPLAFAWASARAFAAPIAQPAPTDLAPVASSTKHESVFSDDRFLREQEPKLWKDERALAGQAKEGDAVKFGKQIPTKELQ